MLHIYIMLQQQDKVLFCEMFAHIGVLTADYWTLHGNSYGGRNIIRWYVPLCNASKLMLTFVI